MIYARRMNINFIYPYFLIVSILAAISAIILNSLRSAETTEKSHFFPYSVRKLFIEDLKKSSNVAYDLFERRLSKNKKTDGAVIALIGIVLLALIILGAILVPYRSFNLRIFAYNSTFNYYFFEYVIIDYIVIFFLLMIPLKFEIKIDNLMLTRLEGLTKKRREKQEIGNLA